MAVYKCKMCGANLEISEGVTVAECEYCDTLQTVPKVMDENMQSVFNRANTLRLKSEFDKAEALYEKILQTDETQAEAYWGLILCKYGIEYVDDPATFKKIPTCHRTSFDSIIADDDYKSAIKNADLSQRTIYEEQAKEIDRIQKEILALSQKEEAYDVFICYKETDADGKRTHDSVIANDIYHQLTQEGLKVFYAAITLEGKLGSAYEPIIFAALNSAKVMLSIGTKPEYFGAVWVKNEWSRFLKMMKTDRSKLLIPCYKDMDAYELPEEFAHLQAQDMSKIGFINDVVRGIKKVIQKDEPKQEAAVKETVVKSGAAETAPLLKRAFLFLDDEEWGNADGYCEKVLDIDPECAEAYLGKLMAELKVKKQEELKFCTKLTENNKNYKKILQFGDDSLKSTLAGYVEHAKMLGIEEDYASGKDIMSRAKTEADYIKAATLFEGIKNYKDSASLLEQCGKKAVIAKKEENLIKALKSQGIGWEKNSASGEVTIVRCVSKNITNVVIPEGVKSIGDSAFYECESLTSITIPDGVTSIGDRAFSYCKSLTSITIPDGVTSIGKEAFFFCESLASISIPDSVTSIGDKAFCGCKSLTSITIPDSVTSIGNGSFCHCKSLKSITIPDSVTSIGNEAFSYCKSLTSITIPDSVTSIGNEAFSYCDRLASITIPDSVTSIGDKAFSWCTSLKSITIPDGVTSIGNGAFSCCWELANITIPDSVTSIGNEAFASCHRLTKVKIPKNATVGKDAFKGCRYKHKKGCYIATSVYGSYDCPQVWTLRRFRDDTLSSTWYGRLFIRMYYATSPTLVKWFGNTAWFKKLWKGKLDRMVEKLRSNGVEDTPYQDKEW